MNTPLSPVESRAWIDPPSGPYVVPDSPPAGGLDLTLVLPTFQESRNIRSTLELVSETLRSVAGLTFEIVVVDDDSPDGTWLLALDQAEEIPELRVMRRTAEKGLATAVIRGWQVARGRILGVMDADLQHPPEVLAGLTELMLKGADLAVGSRHVEEGGVGDWSMIRRVISRTAQLIGLMILPEVVGRVSDPMSGYFLVKRSAIAGRLLNPKGYKILIEVLARGKVRTIAESGYVFQERQQGESKVSMAIYIEYLEHLLRLRYVLLRDSRLVKFCAVGLSGAVIDMAVLYLLSDPRTLHWGLTRSKILATEVAVINNFLWNDAWTFANLVPKALSFRGKLRRFVKFNAICSLGMMLSVILLNLQFNLLGMNRYVANGIAILAAASWNYFANERLGWRSTDRSTLG
jgi:dolichol-phosphate mannosyltransferase